MELDKSKGTTDRKTNEDEYMRQDWYLSPSRQDEKSKIDKVHGIDTKAPFVGRSCGSSQPNAT